MELTLLNAQGQTASNVAAPDTIFGRDYNEALIHQVVVAYQANARSGNRKQKDREEVHHTTKKPWRQKGTGRARAGSIRSPLWVGGGVVFGPKPRDYSKKINAKVKALAASYIGLDLVAEAQSGGSSHDIDIISGATVTVMVLDDSIVRSGLKVARALGLGGLKPEAAATGPQFEVNPDAAIPTSWTQMEGDGTLRRLSLDVGQVNEAFAALGDPRATAKPETTAPDTVFTEMQVAPVSVPAIGAALLSPDDQTNLKAWLKDGDQALMIVGKGVYSFKGSGYVRGGIFDRIVLVQDDISVRFHDRDHKRLVSIAAADAPAFTETDLFRVHETLANMGREMMGGDEPYCPPAKALDDSSAIDIAA